MKKPSVEELSIEARLEHLDAVIDFVDARLGDCPEPVRSRIGLAVDEIFSNIARYAYRPATGGAAVRVAVDGDAVVIEFEDSGAAYDPLSAPAPDLASPAEKRDIGGLGIFMVKRLVDSVEYRREDDKNILTIRETEIRTGRAAGAKRHCGKVNERD